MNYYPCELSNAPGLQPGQGTKSKERIINHKKQTVMKTSKMTTRKFNMIRKSTYLDNYTFTGKKQAKTNVI